jgi:hypothetical protein
MNTHRRLPNGELTRNAREYSRAWKQLAKPIEIATNSKLYAFDPNFGFMSNEDHSITFDMGLYEVRKLIAALKHGAAAQNFLNRI